MSCAGRWRTCSFHLVHIVLLACSFIFICVHPTQTGDHVLAGLARPLHCQVSSGLELPPHLSGAYELGQ